MKKFYYGLLMLGVMTGVTSCIDDKYDLSDIDTTTAIKLDGLVLPVNLESIYLDDVFKVDEENPDNPIIVFTDTQGTKMYAIKKNGFFTADPIFIRTLEATDYASTNPFPVPTSGNQLLSAETDYIYEIGAGKVDDSILRIYSMGLSEPMVISLKFLYEGSTSTPEISNLVLALSENFTAYYKGSEFTNGIIPVTITNGSLDEPVYVYAIDFGEGIEPTGEKGEKSLMFNGKIGIKSGEILSSPSNLVADFSMSPFVSNQISGAINYAINVPEFEGVSLDDIPSFLKEGDSRIIFQNPQFYMHFGNPTTANIYSSLYITPEGNDGKEIELYLDGFNESIICAPDITDLPLENDFSGAKLQPAPSLKNILYGEGIPEYLYLSMGETSVQGDVLNLSLGADLGVDGNYTFFMPLVFEPTSKITYQKSEKDFFGDDVKEVNVTLFQLSAYPTTNLPFDIELLVYPLDKEGNHIYVNGNEVYGSGKVRAMADGSQILDILIDQPFSGLDGVEYRVDVEFPDGDALSPDQFIKLDKIRAKITGEYITKL